MVTTVLTITDIHEAQYGSSRARSRFWHSLFITIYISGTDTGHGIWHSERSGEPSIQRKLSQLGVTKEISPQRTNNTIKEENLSRLMLPALQELQILVAAG